MRTSRRNPPCKRPSYWGRGGAGALFTCSEDNTVLLLLRAEWVEQGGTWGVPGGGIGEGFFRTPMQPITDLAVFREKAEDEVREECGGLPPDMTHLAEGLPFTEYEDCGFRYVTFIVDLTKAQKDAWRPFSADGENDAFIWFPLDEVKTGRPLPDEYGDLHDIHFGVNFTMQNMPAKTNPRRANPRRRNPEEGQVAFETLQSRVRPALRSVKASADFQRWFRGSKVVDEYGNPKVLYHGTSVTLNGRPFTVFQAQDAHPNIVGFFTENEGYAEAYGRYVYPVYLSLKKVLDFRNAKDAKMEANNFYVVAKGVRDVGDANNILARLSGDRHPEIDYDAACEGELPAKSLTKELFTEAVLAGEWVALEATEFVNYLRKRGYDGITMVEEGNINYAVFDASKIKSVTGNRGTYDPDDPDIRHNPRTRLCRSLQMNPRRRNPMRFDLRYAQEDVTERLRGSRAVRSIVSPSLQAANVERMANSPHTFIVVVAPDHRQEVEGTPGAVTLGVGLRTVWEIDEDVGGLKKTREGIYTAFTYLHKLGDVFQTKMLPSEPLAQSLPDAEERSEDRVFRPFYKMLDKHLDLLRDALGARAGMTDEMYLKGIHACVNSKMVREGYVGDWTQSFADLFPLCELTPASRPLLLPVFKRPEKDTMRLPQKAYDVFNNVIVPDFNAKFREFYNALIPTLYGEVIWVG